MDINRKTVETTTGRVRYRRTGAGIISETPTPRTAPTPRRQRTGLHGLSQHLRNAVYSSFTCFLKKEIVVSKREVHVRGRRPVGELHSFHGLHRISLVHPLATGRSERAIFSCSNRNHHHHLHHHRSGFASSGSTWYSGQYRSHVVHVLDSDSNLI